MTYRRSRNRILNTYHTGTYNISRVNYIIYLGIKFNTSLDPQSHIEIVCCRAFKSLGIVMRTASDFKHPKSIKKLYCVHSSDS